MKEYIYILSNSLHKFNLLEVFGMNGKLSHYGTFTSRKNSCCYGNSFVAITIPILMCIQMHI